MQVQVTHDTEFGPVVDLFVEMVEHERGLVTLGVFASDGAQRFPPGSCGQFLEQVPPEILRTAKTAMASAAVAGAGSSSQTRRAVAPLPATPDSVSLRSFRSGATAARR
jgi:hypothetical protein